MTAIGVFAHDRPEHLKFTLEALARCWDFDQCHVTIFCDGARTEEAEKRVALTREVAHASGYRVIERERNLCFGNLVLGVKQLCDETGSAIVIEDDVVPAPDFLRFMRESLYRYRDEERVMSINGMMFYGAHPPEPTTFFLPNAFATGWATWKRAWDQFEWAPVGWEEVLADKKRRAYWDFNGKWRISDWFEKAMRGGLACWDPQWAYKIFSTDSLSLFPSRSLIWNTGFGCGMGGTGAPTFEGSDSFFYGDLTYQDFCKPRFETGWQYPKKIEVDQRAYKRMVQLFRKERREQRLRDRGPFWRRLFGRRRAAQEGGPLPPALSA